MNCKNKNCDLNHLPFPILVGRKSYLDLGNKSNFFEVPPKMSIYLKKLTNLKSWEYLEMSSFGNNTHGFHFVIRCNDIVHVCVIKCKRLEWSVVRLLFLGKDCKFWKLPKSVLLYIIPFIDIHTTFETCEVVLEDVNVLLELSNSIGVVAKDLANSISNSQEFVNWIKKHRSEK